MRDELAPFLRAITAALGAARVVTEADRLRDYSKDESDVGTYAPEVLCFVESTQEVQAIMRLCCEHRVAVTPCGARTGKSGGSIPAHGGLALSTERMTRIKEIAAEDLVCVVEPGVVTGDLMKAVESQGLFYPPDPSSLDQSTLGGNIAETWGGPRALKYGVTRDYVLGLEVVLPSGELLRVGRRTIKGVAGYDLTSLFVGSEGTLGIITEATLKLLPLPRAVISALAAFDDLAGAARAVSATLASGVLPRALELLDEASIRAVDGKGFRFPAGTRAAVLVEVDGEAEEPLLEVMGRVAKLCEGFGVREVVVAQNEAQRRALWEARRQVSSALRHVKPFKVSEDIVVPRSKLPEMIERVRALGARHGVEVATYGHAGDGNVHANFLFADAEERARAEGAVVEMIREALALGGTITGEHGVGLAKRELLPLEQGPALIEVQRAIKRLFDPLGILNPGKIFVP